MIPLVDCEGQNPQHFANEILAAMKSIGFVYLKNLKGLPELEKEVNTMYELGNKFWDLDNDVKRNYDIPEDTSKNGHCGYVAPCKEIFSDSKAEVRESYQVHGAAQKMLFPETEIPEFRTKTMEFWKKCELVGLDVMRALAIALELKDTEFFSKTHKLIGRGANGTTFRLLHYPSLPDDIEPGTQRLGIHSDYGTITLVFQDNIGGLEVMDRKGDWVPAHPIPGTVLINAGDMLENWTDGDILATKHRVLVPKDRKLWKSERRSMAFFILADDEVLVKPFSGSDNRYQPITMKQHLENMFAKTLKY